MIEIAQISAGSFFKPKEHLDDIALFIKVNDFEDQKPGGKYGPQDTAYVDVTYFRSEADFTGEPVTEENVTMQQKHMVKNLRPLVGKACIVKVGQSDGKNGNNPAWIFQNVSPEVQSKVIEYVTKKEEAVKEAAKSAPDFGF